MASRFVDANVLLRYLLNDDPNRSAAALELLERIDRGEESAETSLLAIFEVIFTLQRRRKLSKRKIGEHLTYIVEMSHLRIPERQLLNRSLDLYVEENISFADAYIAASMLSQGISEIYSWDADFDRIPEITRLEPGPIVR
jgi:predicted nucleic acid-binding protein